MNPCVQWCIRLEEKTSLHLAYWRVLMWKSWKKPLCILPIGGFLCKEELKKNLFASPVERVLMWIELKKKPLCISPLERVLMWKELKKKPLCISAEVFFQFFFISAKRFFECWKNRKFAGFHPITFIWPTNREIFSEPCWIEPNLDWNYTFPIDSASNQR